MSYVAGKTIKFVKKGKTKFRDVLVLTCHECSYEFEPKERKMIGLIQNPLRPSYLFICPKCGTKQKDL